MLCVRVGVVLLGAWVVCLAFRWSGLWVACVWLAACGLLGLVRCGLCWAARLGACAGVLLVVFCLLRLWWRWLCRWGWRWLPALGGRCLVSLLGLGRCPRCRSVVVWLAGLLLGLCVSLAVGGAWRRCVFWWARVLWSFAWRCVWVWVLVLALVLVVVAAAACFVGCGLACVLAGAGVLVLVVLCGVWLFLRGVVAVRCVSV